MAVNNEEFNKAITNTEREVKGYVEVIYNDTDNSQYAPSFPEKALISGYYEINDGYRKNKNYASLEENYTELDGSFLLPNKKVVGDKAGYISNKLFKDITNTKITLNIDNPLVEEENRIPIEASGITIYFFNNVAYDFELKITDKDDKETIFNIKDNRQNVFHQFFESSIAIKKMELTISSMEYSNRRIRISEIDFGISNLYENNELISFTTNEEIDILMQSLPINDCTINLNNYNHDFDPLNPQGLVKYLTQNCVIKPFAGVLTDNGVEYESLGYYYLTDWNTNTDGNVTLNGKSLINILDKLELKDDSQNLILSTNMPPALLKIYYPDYKFNLSMNDLDLTFSSNINLLKNMIANIFKDMQSENIFYEDRILFINRENALCCNKYYDDTMDLSISLNELLEEAKVEIRKQISKINFYIQQYAKSDTTSENILLEQDYTLSSSYEEAFFTFTTPTNLTNKNILPIITYTTTGTGTAKRIDANSKMCYLSFSGKSGDVFSFKIKADDYSLIKQEINKTSLIISDLKDNSQEITLDFVDYQKTDNINLEIFKNNFISRDKKYKISGNFNGNPLIQPRHKVKIETKFGNKEVIITKITNTFDGSLTGYFEGVSD